MLHSIDLSCIAHVRELDKDCMQLVPRGLVVSTSPWGLVTKHNADRGRSGFELHGGTGQRMHWLHNLKSWSMNFRQKEQQSEAQHHERAAKEDGAMGQ